MKPWREAATLILAVRTGAGLRTSTRAEPAASATTTVTSPKTQNLMSKSAKGVEDYKVLILKRSQSNKFMPARMVFPGGVTEAVDHSVDWCQIYEQFTGRSFENIVSDLSRPGRRPPMISQGTTQGISPDVAYRICAIRETFEESGVLIYQKVFVHKTDNNDGPCYNLGRCDWSADIFSNRGSREEWRRAIRKDSREFLEMCKKLGIVPDIWALSEWRNWLTPTTEAILASNRTRPMSGGGSGTNRKSAGNTGPSAGSTGGEGAKGNKGGVGEGASGDGKSRRFDTLFYLCCMDCKGDTMPVTAADNQETVTAEWYRPSDLLAASIAPRNEDGAGTRVAEPPILAPPQVYELNIMQQFDTLDGLHEYDQSRRQVHPAQGTGMDRRDVVGGSDHSGAGEGVDRWMPAFKRTTDSFLLLLPGDYLYPKNVDFERPPTAAEIDAIVAPPTESLKQLTDYSKPLHRMAYSDTKLRIGVLITNLGKLANNNSVTSNLTHL